MARSIAMAPDAPVFRAVVTVTRPDGTSWDKCEGPYEAASAAKARVTYWVNRYGPTDQAQPGDWHAHGHVERGEVTWSRV